MYNIDTSWFSSYLNKRFQQTHYVNDLPLSLTSTCADIFTDDPTVGTSSHSIDTLVETLTTDLLYLFGATTYCWDVHIDHLIKKCNSYLFLLSRIKVFFLSRRNRILFYNSLFYLILISVVLSGVTVVLHWKINL